MTCAWVDCTSHADYAIREVSVKPPRAASEVFVGDIELCGGHFKIASRLGRLNLDWDRVLDAMSGEEEVCEDCE